VLYSALAKSLRDQGRYRESLLALARVEMLLPADNSGPRNLAAAQGNLSVVNALVGDYPRSLALMKDSQAALDRAGVAAGDAFRLAREHSYVQVLVANGLHAQARARLGGALAEVKASLGEDSEDYAVLLADEVAVARQAGEVERGEEFLAEARERATRRGESPASRQFASFLRYDAAFARMKGDLAKAEARQREAVQLLQPTANPFDIAVARWELADIVVARGRLAEARELLAPSLPVMRQSVLPEQRDRKAAESLAKILGL
jgi:serine/threonine-protein kinase